MLIFLEKFYHATVANPNHWTALRVIGAVPLVLMINEGSFIQALGLFVILALTDFMDGLVARIYGRVTAFGKFFDPLADKIFLLSALFALIPLAFFFDFLILCFYEGLLFIIAAFAYFFPKNTWIALGANRFGKAKARSEVALIMLFFAARMDIWLNVAVLQVMFLAVIALAIASVLGHCKFLWKR